MNPDELDRLLTVLRTDSNRPVCLIALFLLSTGARLNVGLTAQWQHVDREHRVWRIPASNSKSKKVRSVPLNDSAIEVLGQLDTEKSFEYHLPLHAAQALMINFPTEEEPAPAPAQPAPAH